MKISIAMTSYNAARYITDQLESFARQTRLPDELVVCDDGSTDGTCDRLRQFADASPFPVRVVVNPLRLGYVGNFDQAVRLCSGDLIFLSDHDDRWYPEKLAEHEAIHTSDSQVGFVFSNADVGDEEMSQRGFTLFDLFHISPRKQIHISKGRLLQIQLRAPRVPGCTISFHASLRTIVLPIPKTVIHDIWFANMLPIFTETRCIAKPLMIYRTHATQTVGLFIDRTHDDSLQEYLERIDRWIESWSDALQRFEEFEDKACNRRAGRILRGKLAHLRARRSLAGSRAHRVLVVVREFLNGNYLRYATKSDINGDLELCSRRDRTRRVENAS
jgi:glycosyltransferase involved in cell wall biosynthesis